MNRLRELTNLICKFPGENLQGTTHLKFFGAEKSYGKSQIRMGEELPAIFDAAKLNPGRARAPHKFDRGVDTVNLANCITYLI